MEKISIKKFFITGEFGKVKLGMTKSEVIDILGIPDIENSFGSATNSFQYGWYEIFYDITSQKIIGMQNEHLSVFVGTQTAKIKEHQKAILYQNDKFSVDLSCIPYGQNYTYDQFVSILKSANIDFIETTDRNLGKIIKFPCGVVVDFINLAENWSFSSYEEDDNKNLIVNGVRIFEPNKTPHVKRPSYNLAYRNTGC